MTPQEISAQREYVLKAYEAKRAENRLRFLKGDDKATEEYIFPNQMEDAMNIVDLFYKNNRRVVSIQKKTKVGADGLMIEIVKLLTTHIDDNFTVNPENVRIITGMSNVGWEKDMIEKAPAFMAKSIFHHGKLAKSNIKSFTKDDLTGLMNGLIIIDEIDSGDKPDQVLQNVLKEAGVLDVKHMNEHNNRFVFISATMMKELYDLYQWGELHQLYTMTIPSSYIGHYEFLERGIIQEYYALNTVAKAEKWIQEDILNHYGDDYRVHIVRLNTKSENIVQNACIKKGVIFRNHTSEDRLSEEEIKEFFKESLTNHIVLGVKGFFRRANLIPNRWKLRIGATHELCAKKRDNSVQIQGLPGRMTGYWRDAIENGHKTGPYRTSMKAIEEYEETYRDPFGRNSYQTNGFTKKNGKITSSDPTMLSPEYIPNLEAVALPAVEEEVVDTSLYRIYDKESIVDKACKILGYKYFLVRENSCGFKETSLDGKRTIVSLHDAVKKVPKAYTSKNRTYYPCYVDPTDNSTLRFLLIIRPNTDQEKVAKLDAKYPSLTL